MKIQPDDVRSHIAAAESWEDWESVKRSLFERDTWRETSIDEMELDLARPGQWLDGVEWKPFSPSYRVDADTLDAYEEAGRQIFAKLRPAEHAENLRHPERYGKKCNNCRIWTRERSVETCPICSRRLVTMYLDEDD